MGADPDRETVVLLHGLWCNRWILAVMQRRLRVCGFAVEVFEYATMRRSPEQNAAALAERIQALAIPRLHFVAHSLGGIVVLRLLEHCARVPPGRVVLLGTPLMGSRIARRLCRHGAGRRLLGHSIEGGLLDGRTLDAQAREVGMIAASVPVGLGVLVGGIGEAGDGVVTLAETRAPWLADHLIVRTNHTGLLFSPEVARQTCGFLRTGRFSHR